MESDNAPLSDDGLDSKPAATGSPTTAAAAHSEISRDRTDEPSLQLVPPKDVCGGAWLMFLVMGVGLLFPWNAILQATDFFLSQFPCSAIEFDLSVAYMASVLVTVVVALVIMNYCKSITAVARVSVGFVFMLASLFTYGIAGDSIAYQPAVWTTVASGVGDGLAQTGLYGMSSTLPPKYTTATMIGNGVSGVIVTILRIATKKAFPAGKEGLLASTDMYFYIAASFVVLCIICVATIECVPIVKFYRQVNSSVDAKTEDNVQNNRTPSSHARAVVLALLEDQRADSARYGGIDNSEFHESQMDRNVYSSERRSKSVGMAPIRGSTAPLLSSNSLSSSRHNSTSVSTNSLEVPPPISGGFLAPDRTHNAFLRDRAVTAPVKKAYPAWRSRRRIEVDFVQRARAFSQRAVSFGPGRRSFVASFSTTPQLSDDGIPEPNHCRCGDCCGPHKCRFFYILAQMKHHAAIVFLTFFLTLSLYPGEVLEIPATNFSNSTPGLLQEVSFSCYCFAQLTWQVLH